MAFIRRRGRHRCDDVEVWWVLSVVLVALMLVILVLGSSMRFVLQAISAVFAALWGIALVYFDAGRW